MDLLPLSLCLLTLSGSTSAAGNGPETIRVKEGRDATLPCNINKDIRSETFQWVKGGQKWVFLYEATELSGQDGEFKDRVSHSDAELMNGDASITIRQTKMADSGVYTCNFPDLHQTFSIKLVVDPVIIWVEEGKDATLPCNNNKNITSEWFKWMKDGQKDVFLYEGDVLSGQDSQFTGRVSHDGNLMNGDASITIREAKVVDSGVYTCNLPNLNQTFTVYLVVGTCSKPSITALRQTGDSVPLQCEVSDAFPGFKLNISWFNGSGTKLTETQIDIKKSGRSYILNTTVTKSDTYRCVATMEELSHQVYSETYVPVSGSSALVGLTVGLVVAVLLLLLLL